MSRPRALSVQLYTVRTAIDEDLPRAITEIAAIGFTDVELYDFVARADAYRAALADTGLGAPSAHARLVGTDVDEIFDVAASLGVQTVIDPRIDPERWTTADGVAGVADDLNALVAKAASYGLSIGYHNHAEEVETLIDGAPALERFAALLDPQVMLQVDTYWAAVGGQDPAALLQRLGARVGSLHVKDGPITRVKTDQLPVGAGTMDIAAILSAAPEARRVVELDDYTGDVFHALRRSHDFLVGDLA
jgi:sugar phosphate isomerase/epimerase